MCAIALAALCLALTRAEIIERMRAPVITQADGLVQVFADCPEDMRREYQMPIASFAADTVKTLYRGLGRRSERFPRPGVIIHVGDVRTNLAEVVVRVATNENRAVTRLYVRSPGYADLARLRLEVIKGFYRSVERRELSDADAIAAYRRSDPALRIRDDRLRLETWLDGRGGLDDEEGLRLMRKVLEPGRASRRDVLTFASRLYLYPPAYDLRFLGRFDSLDFHEALRLARVDPTIRLIAAQKSLEVPVFGGGHGAELTAAALAYEVFLRELGSGERDDKELAALLEDADVKLNVAYEKARREGDL